MGPAPLLFPTYTGGNLSSESKGTTQVHGRGDLKPVSFLLVPHVLSQLVYRIPVVHGNSLALGDRAQGTAPSLCSH